MESIVSIYCEENISLPISEEELEALLLAVQEGEQAEYSFVELAYVSEERILEINNEFLQHNYVTDVITFRLDESDDPKKDIEGNICVCAVRVEEQANEFGQSVKMEFARIAVHGFLHLIGYDDTTAEDKAEMTRLEDKYIAASQLF